MSNNYDIPQQTTNSDLLSPLKYQFSIGKFKHVAFTLQDVVLPDVRMHSIEQPTPFANVLQVGAHPQFGQLDVTFAMNETLAAYKELFYWLTGITMPEGYEQYQRFVEEQQAKWTPRRPAHFSTYQIDMSDATLSILNSNNNAFVRFRFPSIFPMSLGNLHLSSTNADVPTLTCSASFAVTLFWIEDIRSVD